MCFSASASFATGAVLGVIGVITIKKARNFPLRFFAVIPLIFSIQQFTEGFVWLSLTDPVYAEWKFCIHLFLVFAYVVWPIWLPLAALLLEKNLKRKKVLRMLLFTGIFISGYIACCLVFYPVNATAQDHHIVYTFKFPHLLYGVGWLSDTFYFIATIPALFISTIKRMWMFGLILIASYAVSRIFFPGAVISVWCYFAAALSIIVLLIVTRLPKLGLQ